MGEHLTNPMTILEDNQSRIANPQFHGRAKHINIKFHFIREQVKAKTVELKYCRSSDIIADKNSQYFCSSFRLSNWLVIMVTIVLITAKTEKIVLGCHGSLLHQKVCFLMECTANVKF